MDGGGWIDEDNEGDSAETLRVLGIEGKGDDTEDKDIVQMIITRTKKVGQTFCDSSDFTLIDLCTAYIRKSWKYFFVLFYTFLTFFNFFNFFYKKVIKSKVFQLFFKTFL